MNDILIIFPSWEERSFLGFQKDIEKYQNLNKVFLFRFEKSAHPSETHKRISEIKNACLIKNIVSEDLSIPNTEVEKWRTLENFARNLDANTTIYIDITTMPRSIIWTLFFFFKQRFQQATVLYYKPREYSNEWLSKDPGIPQLLFKHSGIVEFGKPTTLFVLTGYDEDRVIQLVNYYEPQNVIVGECNQRSSCEYGIKPEVFNIDEYDATWGYDIIESKIKNILESSNLIVASLGPKTGAISVYQCFMKYPQIALAYVPCKEFNIDYCSGIGEEFIKTIKLKNV
ncbi:MAG: hypothetical protein LBR10_05325 [Prevotellaceae bacterium]|jgi:hypothetical protein|nr:hypothetical protein [Prevotellaceae bacterium]